MPISNLQALPIAFISKAYRQYATRYFALWKFFSTIVSKDVFF
jgi:hypothetical protein